jgi:dienelactone hydrolase
MSPELIYLETAFKTRWERNNRIPAYIVRCSGEPRAGIILLHGYTMDKEKLKYDAMEMAEAGYTVMIPDLPLHGERALSDMGVFKYPYYGDPEGPVKLFENASADIDVCEDYLRTLLGPGTPIGLTGFSLGGCLTILAMARKPEAFVMGVSVVGSAHVSRLFFTSAVTTDIRNDLVSLGFTEESWRAVVQPIEATQHSQNIHNLLMIGVEDDDIVPAELVRATYDTLEHATNECFIYENYGHFTPMPLVSAHVLPFFERRLSP